MSRTERSVRSGGGEASPRPLRQAVVVLPSAFTLGNLFFGLWAIVSVLRGDPGLAAWLVVAAAVADWLDGRAARLASSYSRFGAELDSLVDMVSFGVAPALIAYAAFFTVGEWSWVVCFLFTAAAALRLARFNVEQAGRAKHHFLGLPTPAAGGLVATFYPFTQSGFFTETLSGLASGRIVAVGMVTLAGLMLSHVPYAVLRPGIRSGAGRMSLALLLVSIPLLIWRPALTAAPLLGLYVAYGMLRALVLQLLERFPSREVLDELRRGRRGARRRSVSWEPPDDRSSPDEETATMDAERGLGRSREVR